MGSYGRLFVITFICLLLVDGFAECKKLKKPKRPKHEEEDSTSQPNVVTYSNFGFNDVGPTYDGFVPSSPDYATYLSNSNTETSTRLYAPAFPTAMDNAQFSNFGQQSQGSQDMQFTGTGDENNEQSGIIQYDSNSYNFGNPPQFGMTNADRQSSYFSGTENQEDIYDKNGEEMESPVYGTKIGSKNLRRPINPFNTSSLFGSFNSGDDKFSGFHEEPSPQENKPPFSDAVSSYYNTYNYPPTFPSTSNDDEPTQSPNSVKYQKVVDFMKYKPTYPSDVENKYMNENHKPARGQSYSNSQNEQSFQNFNYNSDNEHNSPMSRFKITHDQEDSDKSNARPISTNVLEYSVNHIGGSSNTKNNYKTPNEFKDKLKSKPWNYTSDFSSWRYNWNNMHNTSYKDAYGANNEGSNSPNNNAGDTDQYHFAEHDFSTFKKIPEFQQQSSDNYMNIQPFKYQDSQNAGEKDYYNQLKNLYTSTQSPSYWSSSYKNNENSYKSRPKRPQSNDDEVVHIPKRHKYHIKHNGGKGRFKGKPLEEWNKEVSSGRFKSEEDLLAIRNHESLNPSYVPNFKMNNDAGEEFQKYMTDGDYKKLMEKWRQSYMKSKYSSPQYHDSDAYGSESRPMHVPVPKPFPIEIPHPVIVPVPQPYPVRVPVPKPIAVPIVKELRVPIEKPVPYPVYKKVPYPVEKPVPYPVEKEVRVPVEKPYAVPVPHLSPVFHHSRPEMEEFESERENEFDDDEYMHRPVESTRGTKHSKYYKRPRGTRSRPHSRKPSKLTITHYNRRRWPARSPSRAPPRPRYRPAPRLRYHEYEGEEEEHED